MWVEALLPIVMHHLETRPMTISEMSGRGMEVHQSDHHGSLLHIATTNASGADLAVDQGSVLHITTVKESTERGASVVTETVNVTEIVTVSVEEDHAPDRPVKAGLLVAVTTSIRRARRTEKSERSKKKLSVSLKIMLNRQCMGAVNKILRFFSFVLRNDHES
jgi:hypothetical protein